MSAPVVDGSLSGVVAARTQIAHVDGRAGIALVRGYPLPDLAARRRYEDVAHLVLRGELPQSVADSARYAETLARNASLSDAEARLASELGRALPKADALAAAVTLADDEEARASADPIQRAERVIARVTSLCALVTGVEPRAGGSYAERALVALGARRTDAPAVRALEVLLSLESEHGLSASTFACRVAASSGAGAGVSIAAAVATLSGPRHGGATAEALGLLREAAASGDVAAFVRERHARKAWLPGFGHRIYKVPDPRVPPLRAAMRAMGGVPLLDVAEALEYAVAPLYGAKGIYANIDLFGAALLDALGVEPPHFVAAFALGVVSGWLAHWAEQRAAGRLVRPESEYAGPPRREVPELP